MSRDARAAGLSILLAAGLSLPAGTATARPGEPLILDAVQERAYALLAFRYAAGEHAAAVAGVRRLSAPELRLHRDWLRAIRQNAADEARAAAKGRVLPARERISTLPWCPACSHGVAWERFPLLSALLMHAEASWSPPAPPAGPQLSMALDLARLLAERDGGKEAAVGFFLAVAYVMQNQGQLESARSLTSEGLKRFPQEPLLLLAAGTVEEAMATLGYAVEYRLSRAARLYQAVLQERPDLDEARLRLGRVEWLSERPGEAERLFREVLAAESRTETRYLAQLFRGRMREDQGRFDEAAGFYRAALALDPEAQTALLALSHALHRLGAEEESRELLARSLALAGSRQHADAFGVYLWGRSGSYEAVWEWLRTAARREAQP